MDACWRIYNAVCIQQLPHFIIMPFASALCPHQMWEPDRGIALFQWRPIWDRFFLFVFQNLSCCTFKHIESSFLCLSLLFVVVTVTDFFKDFLCVWFVWYFYFEFFVFVVEVDGLIVRFRWIARILKVFRYPTTDQDSAGSSSAAIAAHSAGQTVSVQRKWGRHTSGFGAGVVLVSSAHRHQVKLIKWLIHGKEGDGRVY